MKEAFKAKKRTQKKLIGISGISGIGITWDKDGDHCVRVNVNANIEKADRIKIPSHIGKVKVKVVTISQVQLEYTK